MDMIPSENYDLTRQYVVTIFVDYGLCLPRYPNLLLSELAPATAKRGDRKNVFAAASIGRT